MSIRIPRWSSRHHGYTYWWWALLGTLLILLFPEPNPLPAYEERLEINRYDRFFKIYARRYFGPEFDWHFFKAQAVVESRLDPTAVSEGGAVGIMQMLPETFQQVAAENSDINGDIRTPRWNIAAGIYYDRILWKLWEADRTDTERLRFMLGAYNAGRRVVLEAQQLAIENRVNPFVWKSVEPFLKNVIGPSYRETAAYVKLVFEVRESMDAAEQLAGLQSHYAGHPLFCP